MTRWGRIGGIALILFWLWLVAFYALLLAWGVADKSWGNVAYRAALLLFACGMLRWQYRSYKRRKELPSIPPLNGVLMANTNLVSYDLKDSILTLDLAGGEIGKFRETGPKGKLAAHTTSTLHFRIPDDEDAHRDTVLALHDVQEASEPVHVMALRPRGKAFEDAMVCVTIQSPSYEIVLGTPDARILDPQFEKRRRR